MSKAPPAARMRQINRNARFRGFTPPAPGDEPRNVEQALFVAEKIVLPQDAPIVIEDVPVEVVPEPEPTPEPEPAPEEVFRQWVTDGMPAVDAEPEPEPEPEVVPEPVVPEYSEGMKKAELQDLARSCGLDASGTKAELIQKLDAHFGR